MTNADLLSEYRILLRIKDTSSLSFSVDCTYGEYTPESWVRGAIADLNSCPTKSREALDAEAEEYEARRTAYYAAKAAKSAAKANRLQAAFDSLEKGDKATYAGSMLVTILSKNKASMKITAKTENGTKICERAYNFVKI